MKKPHTRSGRKYPRRKLWIERRDAAFKRAGNKCEVTGEPLAFVASLNPWEKVIWKRACHHILAERWVRSFVKGADVHILENLVTVTPNLHSRLTHAENKLFRADWIGYRSALNQLGFPLEMLDQAMKAICASVNK